MPGAGQLNERFAFDAPSDISDGHGGVQGGWLEQMVASARRQFKTGSEAQQAARLEGRQPVTITIRRSPVARLITTAWRARDARTGEVFNIRSVDPSEDRAWIVLTCERGVAS